MDLDRDYHFWRDTFNGAALAAIAHAFNRRLTLASISSGNDIPNLIPLLDFGQKIIRNERS